MNDGLVPRVIADAFGVFAVLDTQLLFRCRMCEAVSHDRDKHAHLLGGEIVAEVIRQHEDERVRLVALYVLRAGATHDLLFERMNELTHRLLAQCVVTNEVLT
jgi:hypothetical protein